MSAKIPPKPTKDTVYVDVDDEITSIIDKVETSSHKIVALVLPKRATSLQSIVNMKLLKRSTEDSGKNVVLITSEAALLPLAGAAGLHVAKNLQSKPEIPDAPAGTSAPPAGEPDDVSEAEASGEPDEPQDEGEPQDEQDLPGKIDYERPVGALAAKHETDNPETIDLDDEDAEEEPAPKAAAPPKDKKNKVPNFDRFRLMMGLGILGVIALITFIILALFVLPKATITIQTSSTPLSADFNLTASSTATALDTAKGVLPAKLETADQTSTQQATATGQQNNGQKATGSATMSTCVTSPGQLSNVPAGTGISANGLTFITQQNATFSYAGPCGSSFKFQSNSVNITAQQAGGKYNTSLDGASVSGYSSVTASGSASGGTDSIVTILSQSDVDAAKGKLSTQDTDKFSKDFQSKLTGQGEYLLPSTLKAADPVVTSTPAVGQPASTAIVTIKITYTVLTVKKADLISAITAKLADQIDKNKEKLSDSLLSDANITVQSQSSPANAVLGVNESTSTVPIISAASVKKQAKGNKVGDIQAAIGAWPGVKNVDVKLSPFWVSKVPSNEGKIKVVLKEVKSGSSSGNNQP